MDACPLTPVILAGTSSTMLTRSVESVCLVLSLILEGKLLFFIKSITLAVGFIRLSTIPLFLVWMFLLGMDIGFCHISFSTNVTMHFLFLLICSHDVFLSFFFFFLWLHLQHMEVLRPRVERPEPHQVTAMPDPLSETRGWTQVLIEATLGP